MRIRHATVEDSDALQAMVLEYLKEEHEGGSPVKPGDRSVARLMLAIAVLLAKRAEGATLIAEEGEEPVGFLIFYVEPIPIESEFEKVARGVATYVRPERRRKGIARDLLAAREAIAKSLGCDAIQTGVRLNNDAALSLARTAGYAPQEVAHVKPLRA